MLLCITERGRPSITWTRRPARMCVRVQCARGLIVCRWRGSPQGFSVVVEGVEGVEAGGRGGAGGLAGRCNAGKASGDKDSHWCQAGAGYLFGWGSWE